MSSTIPAPDKPLSRFEAQRKLGLIAAIDFTLLGLICFLWITLGFWWLFGSPEAMKLVAFAIVNITITQAWLIVLAFRVMVFVMDLGADINLMPQAAARIAISYWEGRAK